MEMTMKMIITMAMKMMMMYGLCYYMLGFRGYELKGLWVRWFQLGLVGLGFQGLMDQRVNNQELFSRGLGVYRFRGQGFTFFEGFPILGVMGQRLALDIMPN